jgi:hypothetical protein
MKRLPNNADLSHPVRRERMDLIDPHLRRMALQLSRGEPLLAHQAFCDAWLSIVEKEFPAIPILMTPLAQVEPLPARTLNALEEHHATETIGELLRATRAEFLEIPNFGPEAYTHLLESLLRFVVDRCCVLESITLTKD